MMICNVNDDERETKQNKTKRNKHWKLYYLIFDYFWLSIDYGFVYNGKKYQFLSPSNNDQIYPDSYCNGN